MRERVHARGFGLRLVSGWKAGDAEREGCVVGNNMRNVDGGVEAFEENGNIPYLVCVYICTRNMCV